MYIADNLHNRSSFKPDLSRNQVLAVIIPGLEDVLNAMQIRLHLHFYIPLHP